MSEDTADWKSLQGSGEVKGSRGGWLSWLYVIMGTRSRALDLAVFGSTISVSSSLLCLVE